MKKLTSFLLVFAIISSCFAFMGCINLNDDITMKEAYLRQFGIKDVKAEDVVIDYDAGTYNGARVVMLDAEWHDPNPWMEKIGEKSIRYYDNNRLLVYQLGKFYTLTEAKEKYLLFSNQIEWIIYHFNNQIKHFRDTCDVYDFTDFWLWDNFDVFEDVSPISNMIAVQIDRRIVNRNSKLETEFNIVSFLGDDIIAKEDKIISQEVDWICFSLYLSNEGYDNIQYVFERISKIPGVLSAGYYYDYYYPYDQSSNDYYYDNPENWGVKSIYADKVWDFTTGSLNSRVGIIDSGVSSHPDLTDNLMSGYNYITNSEIIDGDVEHGTMVAGVLGAKGNNSIGMCGVCWKVGIVPLKIYPTGSNHTTSSDLAELAAQAIYDATTSFSPLKILNISLMDLSDNLSMKEAIINYPGLVVCSAGNSNLDVDVHPEYPDYYGSSNLGVNELDNIIVVGGLDKTGSRYFYSSNDGSNYGLNTVDIYAPGLEILTTHPEEYYYEGSNIALGYIIKTGTSFAAPYVSGVAALLLSIEPDLTAEQLKECIIGGADSITIMVGENNNESQSAKKLNAWGAFKYLMDNYYTFDADEIYSIGTSSIQFNDEIQSTNDYSTFKTNTSFIKINIQTAGHYNFTAIADNDIKIGLYDSSYELITERSTYATSQASTDFLCYLQPGTYYLKTNFLEEITGDGEIDFTVNYTQEDHQATRYLLYSSTHHRCVCECGELVSISPHTVKLSEVILGIGHCMYCGARVMLDDTIVQVPGINNVSQVTLNGSYILPNGIIVLVDSDIEAYESGTLVFYDKDDLPVVQ